MHQIKKKSNIEFVFVTLFGNELVPGLSPSIEKVVNEKYTVPLKIAFNSNWRISHVCENCHQEISFGENYEIHTKEYTRINWLDSENYTAAFLENIILLFNGLKLTNVNGEFYINRLDFEYLNDLQRTTSDAPILYSCPHCRTEYLSRFRIGMPQVPEKPNPSGMIGAISIDEIIQIEVPEGKRFMDVLKESEIKK